MNKMCPVSEQEKHDLKRAVDEWAAEESETAHRMFHFTQEMDDDAYRYLLDLFDSAGFELIHTFSMITPNGMIQRELGLKKRGVSCWTGPV